MINEEFLKKFCSQFDKRDAQIVYDYFHFADNLHPFAERRFLEARRIIKKLLQYKEIQDFSYSFLYEYYLTLDSSDKKPFYQFVFYLCEMQYIPKCSFYKLLPLKEIVFSNLTMVDLKYWLNLKDEHFKLFLQSTVLINWLQNIHLLFFHLDSGYFIDNKFYTLCNDKIEIIKFKSTSNIIARPIELENLRNQLYYIGKIRPKDFSQQDFITVTQAKWASTKKLCITFFDLLREGGYLHNTLISDTVNLLSSVYKKNGINCIKLIPKIVASMDPNSWNVVSNKKLKKLKYINCSNPNTLKVLIDFSSIVTLHRDYYCSIYLKYFDNSLSNPCESLSFYSYLEQIEYYSNLKDINSKVEKLELLAIIHSFYTFYQSYELDVFSKDGYPTALLSSTHIAQLIANGYDVINYNSLATVPKSDKWIFCYKDSCSSDIIKIYRIDLSDIKNPIFRGWYKSFLWYSNMKKSTILHDYSHIRMALNYITELKNGTKMSFYTRVRNLDYGDIDVQEIRALKTYVINTYSNSSTRNNFISHLVGLLKYISSNKIHRFNKGVFYELSITAAKNFSQNPIPLEHLKRISNKISELSYDNLIYQLYYVIFYIALETSFRSSQILNLGIDCVKPTAKNNEYIICSETKTSNQEEIEQPISIYVKRCIDEALRLTSDYRISNTYDELNQKLFIIPSNKKFCYKMIGRQTFNDFLYKVCDELNIPRYSFQNLRDFHMTMAEEYIIRQKLTDSQLKILTHHKSTQTTLQHYSKPNITEILEAVNGVIIGNVDIKGNVTKQLPKEIDEHSDLVSEECGYCSSKTCTCFTDIDCLLCEHFVTTFSRKVYFEERIKMIDKMIPSAIHPHDKEDMVNKKRLLLAYLSKIIEQE